MNDKLDNARKKLAEAQSVNEPRKTYVLWTGKYEGNAMVLWSLDTGGYTTDLIQAGTFTKYEAYVYRAACPTAIPIPLNLLRPGRVTTVTIAPETMGSRERDELHEYLKQFEVK